ncbi:uncharacterized protein si:ch1073-188e1.1 isoform X2 [Danio rerio]|uniref:Uncharacterized protein si:ch1073-188e1.1 isoform X2 n=1 Tax=Danio rerio TaxID=7955 RepID=A0AC58IGA1_DANRE|nr:uncharacterized protein si:ch1073-188e1.1 isoform X2 [Danio rerio]|eukprot:XP_021325221.1 uncharacterized protein si:ch1073-188e1.1 isoform X2 [Danio rerio]
MTSTAEKPGNCSFPKFKAFSRFKVLEIHSGGWLAAQYHLAFLVKMNIKVLIILSVVLFPGFFGAGSDRASVSVIEGDSVTLPTDVIMIQEQDFKWYFNDTRIAQMNGDRSYSCTDVHCNEGTERFRGRLTLDHQTGSLTIINTTTTDSGNYSLDVFSQGNHNVKTFSVSVYGVSAALIAEVRRISVEEGKSVNLDSGVARKPNNDLTTWHFNDILIAEVTGEQSRICTNDQCMKLFKDRLKLDNHTGSLTITYITTEQAGLYKLFMVSSGSSIRRRRRENSKPIVKNFRVDVTKSGLSPALIPICVAVALLIVAIFAGWICYQKNQQGDNNRRRQNTEEQRQEIALMTPPDTAANGTSQSQS